MPVDETYFEDPETGLADPAPGDDKPFHAWLLRWEGWGPEESRTRIDRPIRTLNSASGVLNWCGVGKWRANWTAESTWQVPRKGEYMLFSHGDDTLVSGPITTCTVHAETGDRGMRVEVEGISEETVLADRIILPDPTRWAEIQTTQSHDRRSGTASSVLIAYAAAHTQMGGPLGTIVRDFGRLTMAPDPMLGPEISMSERYSNLLDVLQRAAIKGELGFRVTRPRATLQPTFEVVAPRDRSAAAVFSAVDKNVTDWTYRWRAPEATTMIAGGQGELTARLMARDQDSTATWNWRRSIERFRDQRSEDNAAQLHSDNLAALADAGPQETLTVAPSPAVSRSYGTRWRLGDIVRARAITPQGHWLVAEVVDRVQQVAWRADEFGVQFSPVIGTEGESDLTGGATRALARRLTQIEGAQ